MRATLVVLLIVAAAIAGGAWYVHSRLAYTPSWYRADAAPPEASVHEGGAIAKRIERELESKGIAGIRERELPDLLAWLVQIRLGVPMSSVVRGLHTQLTERGASVEMVVSASKLAQAPEVTGNVDALARLLLLLPGGALDHLYVAARIDAGEGPVARRTTLQVGDMKLALADVISKLDPAVAAKLGRGLGWLDEHRIDLGSGVVVVHR